MDDTPRSDTPPLLDWTIGALALAMVAFHLAAASPFLLMPNLFLRGVHLLFALVIGFLTYRLRCGRPGRIVDGVLIALSLVCLGYLIVFNQSIVVRPPWTLEATPLELFVALGTIVVVLELTRRTLGYTITILCLVFIAYGFAGPYLRHVDWLRPLAHRGVGINEFVDQIYFSFEGIFGTALGVSTEFIFLFVVFGAVLQVIGGGEFFIDVTRAATGRSRGGPAKMAVVASALMGSMSGSSVANVATTGALTIPLMKRLGYKKEFAGAVEAVASTGGQITPPIMGAAAFLMAAILGIEYLEVAQAAVLPALLFFGALLAAVHWEALKQDLKPLEEAGARRTWAALKEGWTFLIPLVVLVTLLVEGYTASYCAFFGVVTALAVPYLRRSTFVRPATLARGLRLGAEGAIVVAIACASAGIIVGIVQISGLGFRFSSLVVDFAGNSLPVALVLAMVASFIFGMGMPTTPAYIIQATLVAPALIDLGADPLAAHLFVFYFAVLGQITPPVAVAAYAAAPIAGASAAAVGWRAFALGAPVYIIPFFFVASPELLLQSLEWSLVPTLARCAVAVVAIAMSIAGWMGGRRLPWYGRIAILVAACLTVFPDPLADAAAVVLLAGTYALQRRLATRTATP
ncbi:TRAP transporter permease [Acuticoccus mangrovi]|uniref:TRAP transporter fused permease subunit n=1 Tax=Acuticoccus mangrovi TaxID=2796142 RepID=A0A934MIT7_9HYPH|nr:TRAP transporter fused permease subunit [Acuticoccus mangrovi]MBJ3777536.1 TRAP transporter fused permease subunit [Acuticoccus mangrovi]